MIIYLTLLWANEPIQGLACHIEATVFSEPGCHSGAVSRSDCSSAIFKEASSAGAESSVLGRRRRMRPVGDVVVHGSPMTMPRERVRGGERTGESASRLTAVGVRSGADPEEWDADAEKDELMLAILICI